MKQAFYHSPPLSLLLTLSHSFALSFCVCLSDFKYGCFSGKAAVERTIDAEKCVEKTKDYSIHGMP